MELGIYNNIIPTNIITLLSIYISPTYLSSLDNFKWNNLYFLIIVIQQRNAQSENLENDVEQARVKGNTVAYGNSVQVSNK